MTDWEDQLADFGLEYEPSRAIKAQALANFITECTTWPLVFEQEGWELQVDNSYTKGGCGAGLVIKPPVAEKMEYVIKFQFFGIQQQSRVRSSHPRTSALHLAESASVNAKSDSQLILG